LPGLKDNECGAKSIQKFNASKKSKYVFAVGTADTARYGEDGEKCDDDCVPDAPYHLIFRPTANLPTTSETTSEDTHWINQLKTRGEEGTTENDPIPEGTHLFDVYAMWGSPTDGKGRKHDRTPSDRDLDEFDLIGKIESTSAFITSLWGDEKLFF